MTNFIYNMQDELFHLNMILPVGEFSPIKKLVDHIEAQGKQLRELNAAITKRNKTIEKYEREKKDLQERNSYLSKKVNELNIGIRDSEDLTWKQKYDALLHSSEQAIGALQKKCQEYKNSESDAITSTIETLIKENNELKERNKKLEERRDELIKQCDALYDENKELKEKFESLPFSCFEDYNLCRRISERCREAEKALEEERQVNKNLNVIINSKNKLLDEYMTKYNNLERDYKKHERTIERQNSMIKYLRGRVADYIRLNSVLISKLESVEELANEIDDVILSEE